MGILGGASEAMTGLKDLLASERGVLSILLVLACTALVITGQMSVDQWIEYTKWIGTVLIASKTVTTALETLRAPTPEAPTATAQPPKE